jgi:hypothetical protein
VGSGIASSNTLLGRALGSADRGSLIRERVHWR